MVADDKDKSTGDPLRDAIIASSRASSEARELERTSPQSKFTIPREEFEVWLTVPDAHSQLEPLGDYSTRRRALVECLAAGLVRSAAETYRRQRYSDEVDRKECMLIPSTVWEEDGLHLSSFWETSQFKFKKHQYPADTTHSFFGVRFEPAGLAGMLKAAGAKEAAPSTPQIAPPQNKGGRPPKEFWEDLLVGMFDQLWHGTLIPKTQADIESAMHDWLSANGHSASERSVRQRAQRLWKVWTKEGNN